ncbi:DUF6886 family protein [Paenibacillus eucommiae]|uniref:Uncharacterized protein n=1 Tax=Paenibacillus eucommiae TaxID=1355755 RepID=A0ABS4IUP0_9BACL|nr:DUF6886 family protein [Paenibacillus eucommiae]MBP1990581.1 hypothetical protein [Paenibacillus eucommiae]
MHLYHFSEDPTIEVFHPRVKHSRTDMPPVVWAIDQEHAFTFYFPRNCPRIVYKKSDEINEQDYQKFFGLTISDIVITVETNWYEAIKEATLYRYTLPSTTFEVFDETAGYYISYQTVEPLQMDPITDHLERLMDMNIDVRFTPNLHPLREAILNSTVNDFGIHRFNQAKSL